MLLKSIFFSYFALVFLVSISECEPSSNGFTTYLIHRASPESPSYDKSLLPTQVLVDSLKRSFHRAYRFEQKPFKSKFKSTPDIDLINLGGEYLMKYSIGTPPIPTIAIFDTGSDLTWTQCRPCLECFNQTLPLFSPRNSNSYNRVDCSNPICIPLGFTHCSPTRRNCLYDAMYGDGSFSAGMISIDSFSFTSSGDKQITFPNILFGCGFRNGGVFSGSESGIFGLGGGKTSFIKQLGPLSEGKFSYCLVSFSNLLNSSKLHFGGNALVSGKDVVSTPLVIKKGLETFYFFTMEGVSIAHERIDFHDPSHHSRVDPQQGNIIIDSGTTLTLLPSYLYSKMSEAIIRRVKLKRIHDPNRILDLCYNTLRDDGKEFPEIVVHLKGMDLKWRYENGFVRLSDNCVCFAARATDGVAIYGNLAQVNFLVGYDIWNSKLSFKATDCLKSS